MNYSSNVDKTQKLTKPVSVITTESVFFVVFFFCFFNINFFFLTKRKKLKTILCFKYRLSKFLAQNSYFIYCMEYICKCNDYYWIKVDFLTDKIYNPQLIWCVKFLNKMFFFYPFIQGFAKKIISFCNLIIWPVLVQMISNFNSVCRNNLKFCFMFFLLKYRNAIHWKRKGV